MSRIMRWLMAGLVLVVLSGCGGGGNPTADDFAVFKTYAQNDGAGTAPAVQDYIDAGVTGVTAANLDDVNEAVAGLDPDGVDSVGELQDIADRIGLNEAPMANINATPTTATYGTIISFDASGSSDSDGSINSYKWSEGGTTLSTAVNFTKDDLGFGTHTITLTVTDDDGATGTATVDIVIQASTQLKKTGQTTCYDDRNASATIDCSDPHALKDDGYYHVGVDPNYSRANDIVTDHITGLEWQDDEEAKTVKKQWLTDENYYTCDHNYSDPACYDTSGDTAATYCANLTLGGHSDWRLPTIDELMYIADRSKHNPAIDTTYFQNVVSDHYWSSTTVAGYVDGAWRVSFHYGHDYWPHKSDPYYVRCVRASD